MEIYSVRADFKSNKRRKKESKKKKSQNTQQAINTLFAIAKNII